MTRIRAFASPRHDVAAVAAKTIWKIINMGNAARNTVHILRSEETGKSDKSSKILREHDGETEQEDNNRTEQKSMRFFRTILLAFFALVNPSPTIAKRPA
jgi:hypothetical protein